ncbi:Copia protein [Cucumis melo var. makuwa]|uniref:Copia protein n=1 Tax=Cucumis melo var. makuwa TaxID=1194695 RepID=A0A5A7TD63_CUCMM|nr:Copia protein [Cucumis melo var. makuwa]TYK01730.1 Copia protein [Cucumis melo var. makuwa]
MSPRYLVMCAFEQNNIVFLFPHNHINPHNCLPLSIVTFGVTPRSSPLLGKSASKRIAHQNSCAYTPQQNGVAKRKNRHLLKVTRCLMLSTSLPSYLWGNVILTAAHLINRLPSRILHLQTPLECLKESYPSTRLVSERGYKYFHPSSRKYFVIMDVTFEKIAVLIVYVDDIVLSGDDHVEINQLKQRMGNEFEIKNLGNLKYFLGMEVARSKEGISVSQRKYILDLLTETAMLGCRPADTLIEFNYRKTIEAYTDSNWTGSVVDRKSTSGFVPLFKECETPFKLFCDNKATISIANNPVPHDRTKYVEIDRHFIKERLDSGSICILYIPSSRQVADVLTKGLLKLNFNFYVNKLGLIDIYVPT